ncbi:hypothetical protein A4R44_01416 [Amycolatopsis sp. M39]|nr:hypothetical protein A4R44_01416 [Amycolatopsis sp. M39]
MGTGLPPRSAIRSFRWSKEDSEITRIAWPSANLAVPGVSPLVTRSCSGVTPSSTDG